MTSVNACCVYDFTISADKDKREYKEIIEWLHKFCKKFTFQKEKGELDGYIHWQGRISLMIKLRLQELVKKEPIKGKWTITSGENKDNDFYCQKEDTRIEGPWTDAYIKIPKQYRIENLYEWQKNIIAITKDFDSRTVHIVINRCGNIGKSTLIGYMCCNRLARKIPPLNNYKDIMRMVMCQPESSTYLVDMPKGLDKRHMNEFFSAIESIKDGHVWDDRYGYKERWFDSPTVIVFTNVKPMESYLTLDRWRFHEIEESEGVLGAPL